MIVATPLPEQAFTILGPVVTVEWFASQITNDTRVFAPYTQGLPRSFPTRAAPTPEPPHPAFLKWFRWELVLAFAGEIIRRISGAPCDFGLSWFGCIQV
jgi:hypothetical protein